MKKPQQKIRVGDMVEYPVTGTRGTVVKLKRAKGKTWALIEPICMWIEVSKLILVERAREESQARET